MLQKRKTIFKQVYQSKLCKVNSAKQKSHQSRLILKPDNLDSLLAAAQSHVISAVPVATKLLNDMECKPVKGCNSQTGRTNDLE